MICEVCDEEVRYTQIESDEVEYEVGDDGHLRCGCIVCPYMLDDATEKAVLHSQDSEE